MSGPKILVVAPDSAFRQSLCFVLEAEGYRIRSLQALPTTLGAADTFDCAVIDDAANASLQAWLTLAGARRPVVLLVDQIRDGGSYEGVRYIEKPMLGNTLVEAVRGVLAPHREANTLST